MGDVLATESVLACFIAVSLSFGTTVVNSDAAVSVHPDGLADARGGEGVQGERV